MAPVLKVFDDAFYQPVDAAMRWAWDAFGTSWRTVVSVAVLSRYGSEIAYGAHRHFEHGANVWGRLAIGAILTALLLSATRWLSDARWQASNLRNTPALDRGLRIFILLVMAADVAGGERTLVAYDAVNLIAYVVFNVAIPIGPRRRRKRSPVLQPAVIRSGV